MPGNQAERLRQSRAVQTSQSLRDYWHNPTGFSSSYSSEPSRRNNIPVTAPSLWGEPAVLTVQPVSTTSEDSKQMQPSRRRSARKKAPDTTEQHGMYASRTAIQELRERIQLYGVNTLSNIELLKVILHTGQASETTMQKVQNVLLDHTLAQLLQAEFGELSNTYQLGESRTAQLQAVGEYARRLTLPAKETPFAIGSPEDAVRFVRPEMEHLDHEEMRVLLLDTKNQVVANLQLYKGTVNSSVLRGAEIFRPAVARNCPNVIIFHNHPSGDPTPSPEDITTTEHLVAAGKFLDKELVDHIIIGNNSRYVSLKERLRW